MGTEATERAKKLRLLTSNRNIDATILTSTANVRYMTGFMGEDSWALVAPKRTYLITDSRYTEQARNECRGVFIIERTEGLATSAAGIIARHKDISTVAIEDCATIAMFGALRKALAKPLRKIGGSVEELRTVKDRAERLAIKKAAHIAGDALAAAMRYVKVGVSESELAGRLNFEIRKRGARESFETIVAFGAHASMAHHLCSSRKLKENDSVLIDWGVQWQGYCSDMTRSFCVGRANAYYTKVYRAVLEAQQAAIATVKAGVKISAVDKAAREVIAGHNLPVYGHGTGHGIGLEVHEGPTVSGRAKGVLKAGQIITIEPGVYIPGKLGIRIEDDILVTESGCEILSPVSGK